MNKPNPSRTDKIQTFLDQSGWGAGTIVPLADDASFRRYDRIHMGDKTAVLMDAPPPKEDIKPFMDVANYLNNKSFSAPEIINADPENGFLLLEDLGDTTYTKALHKSPKLEPELYKNALDCLLEIQSGFDPNLIQNLDTQWTGSMDKKILSNEMDLLTTWYLPEVLENQEVSWESDLRNIMSKPLDEKTLPLDTVTLRDFHADNLMHLPEREGYKQVGLLDFQDALIGHKAYDLVSLLQDARRDVSPDLEEEMIQYFLEGHSKRGTQINREEFLSHYNILGAQRNAKIIGIFTRLWKRDGKSQYLALIPRVMKLFERNLEHPALSELKKWFNDILPHNKRKAPHA